MTARRQEQLECYEMPPAETRRHPWLLGAILVAETVAAAYLTLVTWLITTLAVDDAVAEQLQPRDWWTGAAERLAIGFVVAAVFAVVVGMINSVAVRKWAPSHPRLPRISARLGFLVVFAAALLGAVQFGISKPVM